MRAAFNLDAVERQTIHAVADGHDILQIHRFGGTDESHIAKLMASADIPAGARVLDQGAGVGAVARMMRSLRPDISFVLVNISPVQLSYAPEFPRHCCDFHDVPEPDGSFDAVIFCFSIGHGDLAALIDESWRLLRPGGVLFIYDMVRHSGDNAAMNEIAYQVATRSEMDAALFIGGFLVTDYEEPEDSGEYGRRMLGDDYATFFGGTAPALWRCVKP